MIRRRPGVIRRAGLGLAAFGLFGGLATVANADVTTPTDQEIAVSILAFESGIEPFEPGIEALAADKVDGTEKVLTLNSDILFTFNKATITPAATTKIGELVKALPQKAKVSIGGHTDSLGTDARNLPLSQQRAQVVAAAIKAVRPDLVLTVKGFGKSQPVASNGTPAKDDPQGRAKNRRVEIRYVN